jgi:hypothetical protein
MFENGILVRDCDQNEWTNNKRIIQCFKAKKKF